MYEREIPRHQGETGEAGDAAAAEVFIKACDYSTSVLWMIDSWSNNMGININ